MIARRQVWCFALLAGLAFSQSTTPLEIRGTVVEAGVGIAGVTVTLYQFGAQPAHATTRTVFATTSTDSKGEFTFRPSRAGEYYVEVSKEGYFAESFDGPSADPMDSTGDAVSLDQDHPSQERRFSLMRLGELRGRVVDEDGQAIANLRVALRPATSAQVVTDQDGYFVAAKLRPGDYLVGIVPQRGAEILPEFSEDDLKIVDHDLETSFGPGVPLPVRSGASLTVGTITARNGSYYRARLSVQSAGCAPREKWIFSAARETAGPGLSVPCGKEFLVRNLAPGSYSFSLSTTGQPGETRQWAFAPVEVTDHNLEVAMTMLPGPEISGRIVGAEGVTLPPLAKAMVMTSPVPARASFTPGRLDPAGNFRILGAPGDRFRLSVSGLGTQFYVKEIRSNGLVIPDGIITPMAGSPTVLEIVVDDKAATITGSIDGREKVTGRV